jgi:putative aldouronate transport system substrate-binding protein
LAWNTAPAGDEALQKLSILINSGGKLPDIVMAGLNTSALYSYGTQGVFLPLNDLIDTYGVETKSLWDYDPEIKKQMISPDGKIYGLGHWAIIKHTLMLGRFWINQTWLDNLGIPIPHTTEDLFNALVAFRDNDPNRNGLKDEIPLTGFMTGNLFTTLINSFIYSGNGLFNVTNGKIVPVVIQDEYREGLRYIKRLWDNDLIDKQIFSQPPEAVRQLLNGEYIRGGIITNMTPSDVMDPYGLQTREYRMMPPVMGPKGVRYAYYNPVTWSPCYFVTKDSTNPEAAFRFGDFLCSWDAFVVAYLGEEGVNWEKPKPGDIGINGQSAAIKYIDPPWLHPMQNKAWEWMAPQIDLGKLIDGAAVDQNDPWEFETRLYKGVTETQEPYIPNEGWVPALTYTQDQIEERTPLFNEINSYLSSARVQFISGDLSLDRDWDAFVKRLKDLGIERLMQIDQAALDAFNNK